MERLTEKRDGKTVIPLRQDGKTKWALTSAGMGDAPTKFLYGDPADRLAAYEDTGLEPEEIAELCTDDVKEIAKMFVETIKNGEIDRLIELLQAEKDGRLVVLPCRPQSAIYYLDNVDHEIVPMILLGFYISEDSVLMETHYGQSIPVSEFGKLVFLSYAEAAAALEAQEGRRT